jgi:hypothetical protein
MRVPERLARLGLALVLSIARAGIEWAALARVACHAIGLHEGCM